ncbi:hypothetical protein [Dictyobacter arantiisoli]|nr:hypothetical protein [Dictyobacter arantiisoli]
MGEQTHRLEDLSAELLALVHESVAMGLDSIMGDEDLIPVLNIRTTMIVLQTETLEEARKAVPAVLTSSGVEQGVLIYNGYATLEDGQSTRALLAEAYELTTGARFCFTQQYRPPRKASFLSRAQPLDCIGELKFIDCRPE